MVTPAATIKADSTACASAHCHGILIIPWAPDYDWQGLADQAWALEPDHRMLGRETIQARAVLPSGCGLPPQTVPVASRHQTL